MNKIITVYELLGLIKDDNAPKKIKWEGNIFSFYNSDYLCEDSDFINSHETGYLLCFIFSLPENVLNIKVETLEEDKTIIEKIHLENMHDKESLRFSDYELQDKLNEIIDYINKKESK